MVVNVRDANSFIGKKSKRDLQTGRKMAKVETTNKPFLVFTAGGMETFVRHFIIKDDTGNVDCILWSDSSDKYLELLQVVFSLTAAFWTPFKFRLITMIDRQLGGTSWS